MVMAIGVAIGATPAAASGPNHGHVHFVTITGFCASKTTNPDNCRGLRTVKPGGTLHECKSAEFQQLLANYEWVNMDTAGSLYRLTFSGPIGRDKSKLVFLSPSGKSTVFDIAQSWSHGKSQTLTPGRYSVTITSGRKTLVSKHLQISAKPC